MKQTFPLGCEVTQVFCACCRSLRHNLLGRCDPPGRDRWSSLQRRQHIPAALPAESARRGLEEAVTIVFRRRRMRSTW